MSGLKLNYPSIPPMQPLQGAGGWFHDPSLRGMGQGGGYFSNLGRFSYDQHQPADTFGQWADIFTPMGMAAQGFGADTARVIGAPFGASVPADWPSLAGDLSGMAYDAASTFHPDSPISPAQYLGNMVYGPHGLMLPAIPAAPALARAGMAGQRRWNQFGDDLHGAADAGLSAGSDLLGPQYNHLLQPATHWTRQWEPGMSPPHGYYQPRGSIGNYDAPAWRGGDGGGGIYGRGAPRYYQTTPSTAWTNRPPIGDWQAPRMPDHQSHLYPGPSQRGITNFQGDAPPPVTPAVWTEMQGQRFLEEHDPFLTPEGSGMTVIDPNRTTAPLDVSAAVPTVTQFDDLFLPPGQRGTPMPQPKDPSLGVVVSNPDLPHGAFQGESSRIPSQIKQIQDAAIWLREQQAAEAGYPPLYGGGFEVEVPMVPPSQWESFKRHRESQKEYQGEPEGGYPSDRPGEIITDPITGELIFIPEGWNYNEGNFKSGYSIFDVFPE
jgi:hypothetical protein